MTLFDDYVVSKGVKQRKKQPFSHASNNWDSNKQGEEEQLDVVFVHVWEGAAKQTNLQGLSEQTSVQISVASISVIIIFSIGQGRSHNVLPYFK